MQEAEAPRAERAHDRYPLALGATVVVIVDGDSVEAKLRNISYGGLSLEAVAGTLALSVEVEVTLPLDEDLTVRLTGVVCWRRGNDVGIRFEGLRRAARLTVQELVENAKRFKKG